MSGKSGQNGFSVVVSLFSDSLLDAGYGECWLRELRIGKLVEDALLHFDGQRYQLHTWVVMPNHVHVLITPLHGYSLSSILHSWKSFTAKEANRLLGRSGAFWLEKYFDRAVRDNKHFNKVIEYIENNPVKSGLCKRASDWLYGSACGGEEKRAGRPRSQDEISLDEGGVGAAAYADAVTVYLAFAVDRWTIYNGQCELFYEDMSGKSQQVARMAFVESGGIRGHKGTAFPTQKISIMLYLCFPC